MKIFIVCSKHFYKEVEEIANFLKKQGHKITYPNSFDEPLMEEKMKVNGKENHKKWKREMLKKDEENIKPQDAILVLNFEKRGIPNYVGGATFLEIYKAFELNKKVFFYNPLPSCSFTDELLAIDPIIINGDLNKIK
ncbi:MAG: hypothetical protein WC494_01805 [Candidatus Pacearchaeota archaeon]